MRCGARVRPAAADGARSTRGGHGGHAVPTVVARRADRRALLVVQARGWRATRRGPARTRRRRRRSTCWRRGRAPGRTRRRTAQARLRALRRRRAPALVLVLAGGWLLLAERGPLARGPLPRRRPAPRLRPQRRPSGRRARPIAALLGRGQPSPRPPTAPPRGRPARRLGQARRRRLQGPARRRARCPSRSSPTRWSTGAGPGPAARSTRRTWPSRPGPAVAALPLPDPVPALRRGRPELGVLPVGDPEYDQGYGLDRLRELALVTLASDAARRRHPPVRVARRAVPPGRRGPPARDARTGRRATSAGDGERAALRAAARRPVLARRPPR